MDDLEIVRLSFQFLYENEILTRTVETRARLPKPVMIFVIFFLLQIQLLECSLAKENFPSAAKKWFLNEK